MTDLAEIAGRSKFHDRAVSFTLVMQQGIERQRVIWKLREEANGLRARLADIEARLAVEEAEQRLDRQLSEQMFGYVEAASERIGDEKP